MESKQPPPPLPAAIYARISSDKVGAGLGVERQETDCRALAERLGWDVAAVFIDNDVSAYSGASRPQYRAMLDAVRAGRVRGIVAWHPDRLYRRALDLEEFVTLAETHHLQVQTVTAGTVDLTTASGRMVARMLGAAAQHEVDHARERMKRAKDQLALDGKYRGGKRPFGFKEDGVTVLEKEAEVIRWATAGIIEGRPIRALARELNERGLRTSTGKEWTHTQLRDVLLRPRNAALINRGRMGGSEPTEIIGKAVWPAIVDEETWRALVAVLEQPSRRKLHDNNPRWLGSGIYVCGLCGGAMRATSIGSTPARGGRRLHHYRCTEKPHLTITVRQTDEYVRATVANLVRDPRVVAAMMPPDEDDDALRADREKRAVLLRRLEAFENDYAMGDITGAQLARATAAVTGELEQIEARLAEALRRSTSSPIAMAPDPGAAFLAAPIDVQRAIVRAVAAIEVLPAGARGAKWTPQRLRLTQTG